MTDFTLIDDGTLDTVVRCDNCGNETRLSLDCASDYRDPDTGELTQSAFDTLIENEVEPFHECEEDTNESN